MCPSPRLTTAEAWIEFLESNQHKRLNSNDKFLKNRNQNDTLDFRENIGRMDKDKLNIQKVDHVTLNIFFKYEESITRTFLILNIS